VRLQAQGILSRAAQESNAGGLLLISPCVAASAATLQPLLLASRNCFGKMSPHDLANTVAALPELGAQPDQAWLDAFCTTAAAKMPQATPLALYAILFGLARVQQAEKRMVAAAIKQQKVAAAREQRQQQQQQQVSGGSEYAQTLADTAAALEVITQQTAVSSSSAAAVAEEQAQHVSFAQMKLLRAAALWLLRQQQQLTRWQVAGVIMSYGELLPRDVLRQLHSAAEVGRGHTQQPAAGEPHQAGTPAASGPGQSELQGSEAADAIKQKQRQHELVSALQQLIQGWRPLMEQGQLAAVLPKQKAKLLGAAWQRLQGISSSATDSKYNSATGDAAVAN
jgi:hypothetical protein